MIVLTLLVAAILLGEAYVESKRGDLRHWVSLLGTFVASIYLGQLQGIPAFDTAVLYVGLRVWFDIVYNKLNGQEWYYLGTVAFSDRMLKKVNKTFLFFSRCFISMVAFMYLAQYVDDTLWGALGVIIVFACMGAVIIYRQWER